VRKKRSISQIMHPDYRSHMTEWAKFRRVIESGQRFINAYLKRYSKRETTEEFNDRRSMTYCPAFAKSAVNDVKNSIYQRMTDIVREGGDKTYQDAITGIGGGVNLRGASMNNFIGNMVLPELLTMGKVGVYVDMPPLSGETIADNKDVRPYVYLYMAEDIRSWTNTVVDGQAVTTNVLLRDYITETDPDTGLVIDTIARHRRVFSAEDGVHIIIYKGDEIDSEIVLPNMKRIPFLSIELSDSLLTEIANYQIALLNLDSTDLAYLMKANFPYYVEQYEPRAENMYVNRNVNGEDPTDEGNKREVGTGISQGRRYPKGMDAPSFIHPSPEPLQASITKQEQMKNEIRHLLNLSLSNLEPKFASAESKGMDQTSQENGLSAIGLTLEYCEREMAKIWAMYLGTDKAATVNYPEKYSLKSDADRREDAKQLKELLPIVPSITYKKAVAKEIAEVLLSHCLPKKEMDKIETEIENAEYIGSDATDIQLDVEAGLVSLKTASSARGYVNAAKEVKQAQVEHAERLKLVQEAQTPPAQGNKDTNPNPGPGSNKDAQGNPMNPGAGRNG
jgi:hypothetical protein